MSQQPRVDVNSRPRMHPLVKAKSLFFLAAGLSFVLSVGLWFTGYREQGVFVGLWVPSILSAGVLLLVGKTNHE